MKVTFISIAIGAVTKGLLKQMEDLEIRGSWCKKKKKKLARNKAVELESDGITNFNWRTWNGS